MHVTSLNKTDELQAVVKTTDASPAIVTETLLNDSTPTICSGGDVMACVQEDLKTPFERCYGCYSI